ncbi:MAG: PfkB family carbohydrate kinase [Phycisphaerales bacterium]
MSLVCTGTIGIDTVHTPHGSREKILGGSCTYFAAAASFHGPVRIVAAVGGDFPPAFRRTMESFKGVDLAGLEVRPRSHTFAWGGRYHANMNSRDTLFTELGVLAEPPPVIPAAYLDSRFVFLANTHPAVQLGMLDSFAARQLVVADTMDLWINTARAELDRLLTKIDGLVLNYDEAELLTGRANSVSAARHILERGPKFVVVKKGEHGALIVHREGIAALPAYPSELVIDPTGAGDSFAGGMMGSLAAAGAKGGGAVSFDALRRAIVHGTVIASFTIESFSLDRLVSLTRAELDRRFDEYARMVRV